MGDLKKVNRIHKTYVRSAPGSTNSNSQEQHTGPSMKKGNKKPSKIPCKDFNEGRCSKTYDHDSGLITNKHVCAFCLY